MDLIERDAVFHDVSTECSNAHEAKYYEAQVALTRAKRIICAAPAVNRWISVDDELPEPLQNVIVCTDINTVTVAWLNGDHWTFADTGNGHTENWSFDAVKYWMLLPEPPKGEQK